MAEDRLNGVSTREYIEALMVEFHRAEERGEREREKAAAALREALTERIVAGDKSLERHIEAQVESVRLALASQQKLAQQVDDSAKEAVEKAFAASTELASKHNELIRAAEEKEQRLATKADLGALREIIEKSSEVLAARVAALESIRDRRRGQEEGVGVSTRAIAWALGSMIALLTLLFTILAANHVFG